MNKMKKKVRVKEAAAGDSSKCSGDSSRWVLIFVCGFLSAVILIGIFRPHPYDIREPSWTLIPPEIEDLSGVLSPTTEESREKELKENECEALKSLDVALMFKWKKRYDKALKVFKHALALSPKHPKILNYYGEFIEDVKGDILEADKFFARALCFSESRGDLYSRALENRRRTSLIAEKIDRKTLKRIEEKKRYFHRLNDRNSAALKRAKKEAYYQHIYHTVGIEGNTMTLAQTRSILESKVAIAGKSIMEHNEVLGLDAALKYVNQTLVDKMGDITISDILEIHKRVIGFVDPLEAGKFRITQVYVGDYAPPHPSQIDELMTKFIEWLNSSSTMIMHPIQLAALAHYKLVYIHPFTDGNGRTSRLLMNLILMVAGYPPVIIRKQDRLEYYRTLVEANNGDARPFVRFIAQCTERTLDAYEYSSKAMTLVPFGKSSKTDEYSFNSLRVAQDHLDYQDKIIMGGSIGPNLTVET